MVLEHLDVNSVRNDLAILFELTVLSLCVLCESELSAHHDPLSAWELEHGSL